MIDFVFSLFAFLVFMLCFIFGLVGIKKLARYVLEELKRPMEKLQMYVLPNGNEVERIIHPKQILDDVPKDVNAAWEKARTAWDNYVTLLATYVMDESEGQARKYKLTKFEKPTKDLK